MEDTGVNAFIYLKIEIQLSKPFNLLRL